jgi:hypothetical protein
VTLRETSKALQLLKEHYERLQRQREFLSREDLDLLQRTEKFMTSPATPEPESHGERRS